MMSPCRHRASFMCEQEIYPSIHVSYGSALPLNPSTTIHGRPIPPGYTSITVEQIVGNNEDLELDFVGGGGEKTLGDALHGVVLWRKADIKLTASTTALVQTDHPSPQPPSPPSPQPHLPHHHLHRRKGPRVLQLLLHQKRERKRHHPSQRLDPQRRSRKRSKEN